MTTVLLRPVTQSKNQHCGTWAWGPRACQQSGHSRVAAQDSGQCEGNRLLSSQSATFHQGGESSTLFNFFGPLTPCL